MIAVVAALCTAAIGLGFQQYFEYKEKYSPGWHTEEEGTYYIMRSDHERATGMKLINNASYLFNEEGHLLSGWQVYEGNTYYFDESGVMQKGIIEIDGEEYYLSDESGIFKTGLQDFNGEQFYFDDHGMPGTGFTADGEYYHDEMGKRISGWWKINDTQYYFFESGENKGKMAKGWTDIKLEDGKTYTYYFGIDGHMFTGRNVIQGKMYDFQEAGNLFKGWRRENKDFIYADEKTGAFASGFKEIDGETYFFDQDFHMVTGWAEIAGKTYHFDKEGKMTKGWFDENLQKYYFCEDGSAAEGFIKEGYEYYYFDPESKKLCYDWHEIDGELYYFGDDGKVWQGFYNYKGSYYYFDQKTHKAVNGLFKTLPFTDEQKKNIKSFKNDIKKLDEFLSVKASKGIPDYPNDVLNTDDDDYQTKLNKVNSDKAAFRKAVLDAGYTEEEEKELEELYKNYKISGYYRAQVLTAYQKFGDDLFDQHYFGTDRVVKTGWQTVNGYKFYFDPLTGEKVSGWRDIAGKRYYFGDFGVMATGRIMVDGKLYDFGSNGYLPSGVYRSGNKIKYIIGDNQFAYNFFGREGNKLYYFDESGNAVSGWQTIDGKLYFFNSACVLQTGFQKRDNDRVFITENGALKNTWLNEGGATYYFNDNCAAVEGWQDIDGERYYFGSDNKMKSGWQTIDGRQYYFENGALVRGVFNEGGKLRAIGNEGYIQEGWIIWNNRQYYTDSEGVPITDTSRTIDGVLYTFDKYGAATRLG